MQGKIRRVKQDVIHMREQITASGSELKLPSSTKAKATQVVRLVLPLSLSQVMRRITGSTVIHMRGIRTQTVECNQDESHANGASCPLPLSLHFFFFFLFLAF